MKTVESIRVKSNRPFSRRIACLLCAMLVLASLTFFATAQEAAPKSAAKIQPVADEPAEPAPPEASRAAAPRARGILSSIRERREKRRERGLELPQLVAVAEELKAEGEITKDTPDEEIVAAIAARVQENNPNAYAEASAIDLQGIIDFIERLLPLILKLIGLFG